MNTLEDMLGIELVVTGSPEQTALEVAQILAANNIGALPVVAEGRVVGIVSERDIIGRVVATGADPKTTRIEGIMTKDPVTVDVTETPTRALLLMKQNNCRHLPVVRDGKLLGMISLRDLLQVQLSAQESELQILSALPDRSFE